MPPRKPKPPLTKAGRVDFSSLKVTDVARAFGVSRRSVQAWIGEGMPQNADSTVDLPAAIKYRMDKLGERKTGNGDKSALEIDKLRLQVEKLQNDLDKQNVEKMVEEEVDRRMADRARSIARFFPEALRLQVPAMEMKGREHLYTITDEICAQILDTYRKGE